MKPFRNACTQFVSFFRAGKTETMLNMQKKPQSGQIEFTSWNFKIDLLKKIEIKAWFPYV